MTRLVLTLAGAGLTLGLAASASAQSAPAARQCFASNQVTSVVPVGDRQVNLQVNHRDVYRLDLNHPCASLRSPQRIIELSPTASASSLCTPADFTLAVSVQGSREDCFVDKVTKLTPAEVASLSKRERP